MTDTTLNLILNAGIAVITVVIGAIVAIHTKKLDSIEKKVDGNTSQVLDITQKLAENAGVAVTGDGKHIIEKQ